jgi:feruloyl esterase
MAVALQDWVEKGTPPEDLIATRYASDRKVLFQRPLCVYPKIARYQGGPPDAAASFACVTH